MKRMILLFTMLCSVAVYYAQFTDINAGLPGVLYSSVAWGDYDNDGDLDILLRTKIFRNDGNGNFTDINAGLPGVDYSSVAWGDYDNDGDLDILLSGYSGNDQYITKIYRNDGNGIFTDINAGLPGVYDGSVAWGDLDNDGDLDILLSGYSNNGIITKIFRNDGNGIFTDINAGLPGVNYGSVAWGDYDNDGDLDILLSGYSNNQYITKIYRNDGNGIFMDINAGLPGVYGSVAWGDYDNDGDLDILLSGYSGNDRYITKIFRYDGNGYFTDINAGLPGVSGSSIAWGDYDNDGDLDILLCGYSNGSITKVFRNDGNGNFTDINAGLPGVDDGSVAWGDYDNDGDLDILLTGRSITKIFRNDIAVTNNAPSSPQNLSLQIDRGSLTLTWDAATDDHTPSIALNYNLRVGTISNPDAIVTSMSSANGYRMIAANGNAGSKLSYTVKNLPASETIIASVQAIDQAYKASAFSASLAVQTPIITAPCPVANVYPMPDAVVDITEGLTMRWDFAESPDGDFATGYLLYVGTEVSSYNLITNLSKM